MIREIQASALNLAVEGMRASAAIKVRVDRQRSTPAGQRLLGVIAQCLRDDFTSADRAWFGAVEQQRAVMLGDTSMMPKVDFGAGARGEHRTEDQMSMGVIKQLTVADVCRSTSKSAWWARILYALITEYKPARALELGTSVGVSAAYQGGALQRIDGRLVTIEGAPEVATIAKETISALGLDHVVDVMIGRFSDVLPTFLGSSEPLDFVFVDGHHDEEATLNYHRMIKPYLAPGAVVVYDDIRWSPGMERAWAAISADPDLCVAADLRAVGLAVFGSDIKHTYRYHLMGA